MFGGFAGVRLGFRFSLGVQKKVPRTVSVILLLMHANFSILDLLVITAGVALATWWYQMPAIAPPEFDDLLLRYHQPNIPNQYLDLGRSPPSGKLGISRDDDYTNGSHLYTENHRVEWHAVATHFVRDRPFWRDNFQFNISQEQLSDTEWTNAHALFARIQGQTDAVNQLEELIVEYTESGLRNELLSIPWYRTYLNHSRQFVFSGLLAIAIVLRFTIMPKRKRKGLSE